MSEAVAQETRESFQIVIDKMFEDLKLIKIEIFEQQREIQKKWEGVKKEMDTWLENSVLEHKNSADNWTFEMGELQKQLVTAIGSEKAREEKE